MLADRVAVVLHDFAGDAAEHVGQHQHVDKPWPWLLELEAQGVAVERTQTLDRCVVVERLLALDGSFTRSGQALDLQFDDRFSSIGLMLAGSTAR